MAVRGKYRSRFEREQLWAALLDEQAICFAVPEIDHLERLQPEETSSNQLVWQGSGTLQGVGLGAARITATIIQPLADYMLEFQCKIGSMDVKAQAEIQLTVDDQPGTRLTWDATIINAATGRPEAMFELTAGLMAQHFFKRIDQYLSLQPTTAEIRETDKQPTSPTSHKITDASRLVIQ